MVITYLKEIKMALNLTSICTPDHVLKNTPFKIEGKLEGRTTLPLRITVLDHNDEFVTEKIVNRLGQFTINLALDEFPEHKRKLTYTLKAYDRLEQISVLENVHLKLKRN